MALTASHIRAKAIPGDDAFMLEDDNGLYLLVEPNGNRSWHLHFELEGAHKEIELGAYPKMSLEDARKKCTPLQQKIAKGVEPETAKQYQPPKQKSAAAAQGKNAAPSKTGVDSEAFFKEEPNALIAYRINKAEVKMPLVPGPKERDWMEQTPNRFAYRCLPMLMANQSGWMLLSNRKYLAVWDGRGDIDAVKITVLDGDSTQGNLISIFGSGIITFTLPYIFRTPPGYNLIAQGPTNMPKDGISALSGVVETDWAEATFTMNWKITRPHHSIIFEIGEPVCMIVPQRRYELEEFQPVIRELTEDAELHDAYSQWAESRQKFNDDLKNPDSEAVKKGWQKHYTQGKTVTEKRSTSHQSKLTLKATRDDTE